MLREILEGSCPQLPQLPHPRVGGDAPLRETLEATKKRPELLLMVATSTDAPCILAELRHQPSRRIGKPIRLGSLCRLRGPR